jgi:hypothetical protein
VVESVLAEDPWREPFDDGADPGRAEAFVELAPADDAVVGGQLEEMVIPPARVAAQDFEARHFHRHSPLLASEGRQNSAAEASRQRQSMRLRI